MISLNERCHNDIAIFLSQYYVNFFLIIGGYFSEYKI
jgi:hypothetical protein